MNTTLNLVIPAKAGIQATSEIAGTVFWIPAFAGMTKKTEVEQAA